MNDGSLAKQSPALPANKNAGKGSSVEIADYWLDKKNKLATFRLIQNGLVLLEYQEGDLFLLSVHDPYFRVQVSYFYF
jgi:hypothetical protein